MAARPKVYSRDEDLMKVPLDQEVLVSLEAEPDAETAKEEKPAKKQALTEARIDEDTVEKLNEQIEELRESNKKTSAQLAAEQSRRSQAERAVQEVVREAVGFRDEAERSQKVTLQSALDAAQAEQEASKGDYLRFLEAGEFAKAADAQQKMSRAAAKIVSVEGQMATYDVRMQELEERRAANAELPRQQVQPPVDVLTSIETNPNFLPREKEWLKSHPELLTDGQKNAELGIAYNRAMSEKLSRGTPEYFEFLEDFLGFKKMESRRRNSNDDSEDDAGTDAAAPVRRDNQNPQRNAQRPTQVKLTKEQRELAQNMGISEIGYARQFLRLQSERKADPEKYNQSR